MPESIRVYYSEIGSNGYHHKYIVYTDTYGNKWGARGGPEFSVDNVAGSTGAQVGAGNAGVILVQWGRYNEDFKDYDISGKNRYETIKEGSDLLSDWVKIAEAMNNIGAERHPYKPLTSNSNSTVDEALYRAGLPLRSKMELLAGTGRLDQEIGCIQMVMKIYGDNDFSLGEDPFSGMLWPQSIDPSIGTTPDPLVKGLKYVDPLVLDLKGNGFSITPLSAGVMFDANGDAIKTGTAWIGSEDGLLVWDRNNNGLIENGSELFGDQTVLGNGLKAATDFWRLQILIQTWTENLIPRTRIFQILGSGVISIKMECLRPLSYLH